MKIIRFLPMLAFMMAIVSCSSIKVVVDQDKNTDFSPYKTYSFLGWQNHSDEDLSKEDKGYLRDAFTNEFEKRGLQRVNSGGDMQISLYIVTSKETAISGYNDYVGGRGYGAYNHYGGGYGGYYGTSSNNFKHRDKLVGTMIMNVYDGKSHDQIWQTVASKTVTKKPDKRKRSIPSTIKSIMRDFPVKPN